MNLSSLDLNLLLVLDAVLAERSVRRAAKRLHVTPPAVSNALSRLRSALGDPIVTKSGRGIVPTPRALQLSAPIARALRDIDEAVHGAAFDPAHARVQLTLAAADASQLARLPRLMSLLGREMPHARLRVVNVDTMVALGGLGSTEVDVALGVAHAAPGVHREAVYEERMVLVARRGHPRIRERAGKAALAAERHIEIHVAFGSPSRAVLAAFARAGIARDVAAIVPSFGAAAAMVGATDLVTVLPQSVADVLSASLGLRTIAVPVRLPSVPMFLSWHQRTHVDQAMVYFRDLVRRAVAASS